MIWQAALGISSGYKPLDDIRELPLYAAPVLTTSNFVASNRLLNPELPACARARSLHPGERFSRNLEAISHGPFTSPPSLVHHAQRYKYVTEWCTVFRSVAETCCDDDLLAVVASQLSTSAYDISQGWNISQSSDGKIWLILHLEIFFYLRWICKFEKILFFTIKI